MSENPFEEPSFLNAIATFRQIMLELAEKEKNDTGERLAIKAHNCQNVKRYADGQRYWAAVYDDKGLCRLMLIEDAIRPEELDKNRDYITLQDSGASIEVVGTLNNRFGLFGSVLPSRLFLEGKIDEENAFPVLTEQQARGKYAEYLMSSVVEEKQKIVDEQQSDVDLFNKAATKAGEFLPGLKME